MELIQKLLKYLELKIEFSRLSLQQGIIRFLVVICLVFLLSVPVMMSLLFLSLSLSVGIGNLVGHLAWGFLVVFGCYVLTAVLLYLRRDSIQKLLYQKIELLIIPQETNRSDPAYVQSTISKSEADSSPHGDGIVSERNQDRS
ncbi:MAG: hypothetical protein NZ108_02635 [Bacteroidia bacterium]|nr:hypothetical protein [Bacteroidia bacterium]